MIKIILTNFRNNHEPADFIEFDCLDYEIDKSCYKFLISSKEIKYIPLYDWILDAIHPIEQKLDKKK